MPRLAVNEPCEVAANFDLSGPCAISGAYGVHGGAAALVMATESGGFSPAAAIAERVESFRVSPDNEYTVRQWVKLVSGTRFDLRFSVDRGSGFFEVIANYDAATYGAGWIQQVHTFVATGTVARLFWSTQAPDASIGTTRWAVDDVRVFRPVITKTLRTALVADLNAIDGTGNFQSVIGTVDDQPREENSINYPAVFFQPGSGGDEDQEATNRTGMARQTWDLMLMVRQDSPQEALEDLLDDVRQAVERPGSNLLSVAGVVKATVSDWGDDERTTEDIAAWRSELPCTVEVLYHYTRDNI